MSDEPVEFRQARIDDIPHIIDVVKTCEPSLVTYIPYYYWMNIHCFGETCGVAVMGKEIVGWCSIISGMPGKYFLHQIGVRPELRGKGIATRLISYLISKLNNGAYTFELELTIERGNTASMKLFEAIAETAGMHLHKKPEISFLLKESNEDLYVMRF